MHVAAGETVGSGEALFEIVRDDRVWVRVPVYVGAWREIDAAAAATIRELGAAARESEWKASPVSAPPSANAVAATVDLYYALDNAAAKLRPGEKVSVSVALVTDEKAKVLPWPAVLHDIHGGTWVYEETAARTYVRRRVVIKYVTNNKAVLAAGPAAGAKIVTDGAAELFGTEMGFGK